MPATRIPAISKQLILIIFSCLACAFPACGIKPGTSDLDDPVPNGLVVRQKNFTARSDVAVRGAAVIYRLNGSGTYLIRLEGLSVDASSLSGLKVVGNSSTGVVYTRDLRGLSGNQNYTTSVTDPVTWIDVTIKSVSRTPPELATAYF